MSKRIVRLWLVVVLFCAACDRSADEQACSIILLTPRTGTQAALGSQIGRARLLVEEELRDAGDSSVRIREVDTQGQPSVARAELERALARWRAPIIVGSVLSTETREFLEPTLQRGVVVLANGSSDPTIRSLPFRHTMDGFFRNWPADDREGRVMAEYLRGAGRAKKLAVFHANDAYARALVQAFVQRFRELGGDVLGPEIYQTDATSFDSVLRRIRGSDVDGYYIVGLPPDLAGMYNAIRRDPKLTKMPIFTAVAAETAEFRALVRSDLDQIFFTAPLVDQSSAVYFDFRELYRRRFNGDSPDVVAGTTYDALHIAVEAARRAHCESGAIKDYLYKMPLFHGVTGPTAFDTLGDVITKPVAIRYYDKGQLRTAVQTAEVH